MAVLDVRHLKKIYTTRFGENRVQALADVSFTVEEGEFVAIMGWEEPMKLCRPEIMGFGRELIHLDLWYII